MDKIGADFFRSVEMVKSRLGADPAGPSAAIGAESDFVGIVDLIEMNGPPSGMPKDLGAAWDIVEIPAELKAQAEDYREKLIETAVELDEEVMMAYLEGEMPDNDTLRRLIRKGPPAM